MSKHFFRRVGVAIALLLILVLVLPRLRWSLIGLLRNECFYNGWPASYWSVRAGQFMGPRPDDYDPGQSETRDSIWDRIKAACGYDNRPQRVPPFGQPADPRSVPVLVQMLDDQNDQVCYFACNALIQTRDKAQIAVPGLLRLVRHPDVYHRRNAINALWAIGPEPELALPTLIEALKDDDEIGWVNYSAAAALGDMGPKAREAVPALVELFKSEKAKLVVRHLPQQELTLRDYVADAVTKINPEVARGLASPALDR
jgi:hypothetical protein